MADNSIVKTSHEGSATSPDSSPDDSLDNSLDNSLEKGSAESPRNGPDSTFDETLDDTPYKSQSKPSKTSPKSSPVSSSFGIIEPNYDDERKKRSIPMRVWESFQRDPNAHATPVGTLGANGKVFDLEGAARATANTTLARKLKGRHLQMIAIGGSIGKGNLMVKMVHY